MSGGMREARALCAPNSYGVVNTAFGYGGTAVAPSATINTKGSWVQLTASTAQDAIALMIRIAYSNGGGNDNGAQIDIGIGGSGSEQVLIPNINLNCSASTASFASMLFNGLFPLQIPAGSRLSARSAANIASFSGTIQACAIGYDGNMAGGYEFGAVDAIGSSAVGLGTSIAGGSATKGSYTQLVASSNADYAGLIAVFDYAGATPNLFNLDIAVGGSGSETNIVNDLFVGNVSQCRNNTDFLDVQIPAGTRISARAAGLSGAGANVGLTLYGVYA
jgi:hypothetical protein